MLTQAVNLLSIAVTLPVVLVTNTIASLFFKHSLDVTTVTSDKTPVLLLHGSEANQHQWWFFRRYLEGHGDGRATGHVFTVNLNKQPRRNDDNRNVEDYASVVQTRLMEMKRLYDASGIAMNTVILMGNSMGGLVAAAYCIADDIPDKVAIAAVISISTPWKGSHLADLFCDRMKSPQKYFCRESKDREALVARFCEYVQKMNLPVYNYGSAFDLHVPVDSSQLPCTAQKNVLIDYRNEHSTTMMDTTLARFIRDQWILPNTKNLPLLTVLQ